MISPNEVGLFDCSVIGADLRWTVNGVEFIFAGANQPGNLQNSNLPPNTIAALLVRVIVNDTTLEGSRTSVLRYVPDPGFTGSITVSCEGLLFDICTTTVFVGEYIRTSGKSVTCVRVTHVMVVIVSLHILCQNRTNDTVFWM